MRRNVKATWIGVALASGIALAPDVARADASAWAFAGAGALAWKEGTAALAPRAAFNFDFGVGTTPDGPFIVGGLARLTPVVDEGLDVSLLARVATHGFQAGKFGVAVDVGGYQRLWGTYSRGVAGSFTIGLPLGFSLGVQGLYGTGDALAFGAFAGIDFLRLTIYRQSMLDAWPNPYPAHQQPATASFGPSPRFF
ncbi:hypothetical protein [Polyangium spumosum]|uniref:Outer membrane beta-barrel protein n=1 Tax=Polyangium spumosum TaxID=889282 RepID=A0A6N7PJ01_9BACT|nr:hypothetical protein [Polyangium spumosum]MRG91968.1 hypothetical protein [Polyangium spumosum]